jgi:hypothetical protein
MRLPSTRRGRVVAVAIGAVAAASVAGGAVAATTSSMPAANPTDARAASMTVINRTISPAPTSNRGFNGFQTVTVKAPAGKTVLQGFATLTGGQTGSVVIRSTQATSAKYVVKLVFPGQQGTPGKLHVRVQLVPKQ